MQIYEEFFLLAINDLTGTFQDKVESQFGFGISGGILSELALAGRIGLDRNKKLIVMDPHPMGDDLLDEVLGRMDDDDRQHRAVFWISRLVASVKKLERRVGSRLVQNGILQREQKR